MLRLDGAGRTFRRRPVFSGLDLAVAPGTRLLLTGGNGAGKTTLLRCLAGTLALSAGRATVAGRPAGSPAARRLVGVALAPEQTLCGQLSGHDNLLLVARMRLSTREAARAVARVEEELGITDYARVPANQCSAGMRARISVARALLGDPPVVLLDEPGRSLDAAARALLWAALDRRPGLTCVFASHLAEDRARCDRALAMPVRR
ncbi:ATP-binding cassette domain-containing protein [Micromonospora sp. R77]|uniref:ATP-binding cassette domain-containing protein n=1 Tax=Micromonospora sp. R77 TaxID=2925836 RepID=UPI001F602F35|nr:ATP-binding cassette domain-containing protein [Micromonospora sp. R77]MCI4061277.1 ATP-binding cassette domain-containing protein [Micromonospora sp. R77]